MAHPFPHGPSAWTHQHRRLTAVLFGLAALGLVVVWILTR